MNLQLEQFVLTDEMKAKLLGVAADAHANAYCPYSNFPVGAAVLSGDGRIFAGCNVENGSYGLTICAERTAVASAVTAGVLDIKAIAVVTSAPTIARPCGACRQVIAEFSNEESPIVIVSKSGNGEIAVETINTLLPGRFHLL